ncbi:MULTISPECIES: K(+)-transporting ATPase subunit F [Pseudomonas]|uniref:K(+)-transporting ATPase subunit F n=2 Tax=Pseudomonas TaxID=286 RepID=A0ABY2U7D8_9PSED|nr:MULTISPECIES: K(+)-transporting ATPase subunit F [Pseudomonas]MBK3510379.1 K(+)-transporting ATPase subunit F [Pseudomonas sp. MF6747]MBK5544458.1 K(+)-transporting ATPase subunit F [Pseudomonas sp. TH04]MBX7275985.1 K(+)-transporting ATPase subunit F [Pseudomonas sp. ERGC3:01]MCF5231734.1 K(+)-transporting ATPase subunit F [Pseudomonas sp. PA-5-4H]MCF5237981.1 K(+)-transporting ATPase subunit F [Pseudomonas sp. PA-5-4G]MCF5248429.1 K(+)-transporting ATPase subunit F [Pseudomonas sp. PA-5-
MLTLTFIYVASGLCAVGLFAYLGYALIRAEKF